MAVLGIALRGQGARFRDEYKLTFPVLDGSDRKVWSRFGRGFVPHNAVIDAAGVVRFSDSGADLEPIVTALEAAIAERDAAEEEGEG